MHRRSSHWRFVTDIPDDLAFKDTYLGDMDGYLNPGLSVIVDPDGHDARPDVFELTYHRRPAPFLIVDDGGESADAMERRDEGPALADLQ